MALYKDYTNGLSEKVAGLAKSATDDTTVATATAKNTPIYKKDEWFTSEFADSESKLRVKPTKVERGIYLAHYHRTNNSSHGKYGGENIIGPLFFHNVQDLLASFFLQSYYNHKRTNNWRGQCIGIYSGMQSNDYNLSIDGHLPMFDYDGKHIKRRIRQDVKLLQETYGMGDAWVYKTRRGYHVYFFCDLVSWEQYRSLLSETKCCNGFREAAVARHFTILRISAKYTSFDIKLEYILLSKSGRERRPGKIAHVIMKILSMGEECGTHIASMFPQWAHYTEDAKEWPLARQEAAGGNGKRIRRVEKRGSSPKRSLVEELRSREAIIKADNPNEVIMTFNSPVSKTTVQITSNTPHGANYTTFTTSDPGIVWNTTDSGSDLSVGSPQVVKNDEVVGVATGGEEEMWNAETVDGEDF